MGTIVGISDLDPLRWPGSKWRSLQVTRYSAIASTRDCHFFLFCLIIKIHGEYTQVEWDEPGCGDKQTRVSPWEIETPESLFIFPSLTTGLKRPFQSTYFGNVILINYSAICLSGGARSMIRFLYFLRSTT